MFRVTSLTNDPYQKQTWFLPNGESVTVFLYFRPQQFGWFIQELVYKDFVLKGTRITNSPNILFQYMNQIPFGLACYSKQNREPSLQNDFLSGATSLYILSEAECQEYLELVRGQV
jgi:hypothetical protein